MIKMIKELVMTMRPSQWYKNLVIFISIIFSFNIKNIEMWSIVVFAFVIFCLLSGGEYIINDIIDLEKDKKHPKKQKRPIASGRLRLNFALLSAITLIVVGII